jgi:hypothetical protein
MAAADHVQQALASAEVVGLSRADLRYPPPGPRGYLLPSAMRLIAASLPSHSAASSASQPAA